MRQGYGSPPGKTRGRLGRMGQCPMPPPPSARRCAIPATGRCSPPCWAPSPSPACRGCCSVRWAGASAGSPGACWAAVAAPPRSTCSCASPRRTRPGASAWCATAGGGHAHPRGAHPVQCTRVGLHAQPGNFRLDDQPGAVDHPGQCRRQECCRPGIGHQGTAVHVQGHGEAACARSEEHTSELQSQSNLVCRLLLEKKKKITKTKRREGANTLETDDHKKEQE